MMDDRHWVVEAAMEWSRYGTKVTGYDKVDISKALLPLAVEHRLKGQIEFIRKNVYVPQRFLSHPHLRSFMCTIQPETTTPLRL